MFYQSARITTRFYNGNNLLKSKIKCSECGAPNVRRGEMKKHLAKMCPNVKVVCGYHTVGCNWRDRRCKLEQHLREDGQEHVHLMMIDTQMLRNRLEQLEQAVEDNDTLSQVIHEESQKSYHSLSVRLSYCESDEQSYLRPSSEEDEDNKTDDDDLFTLDAELQRRRNHNIAIEDDEMSVEDDNDEDPGSQPKVRQRRRSPRRRRNRNVDVDLTMD